MPRRRKPLFMYVTCSMLYRPLQCSVSNLCAWLRLQQDAILAIEEERRRDRELEIRLLMKEQELKSKSDFQVPHYTTLEKQRRQLVKRAHECVLVFVCGCHSELHASKSMTCWSKSVRGLRRPGPRYELWCCTLVQRVHPSRLAATTTTTTERAGQGRCCSY